MKVKSRHGIRGQVVRELKRLGRKTASNENPSRRAHKGVAPGHFGKLDALGAQLLVEMQDCLSEQLDDVDWVERVMVEAAIRAHATIVETVFHKFNPIGISGVVVIAESHLSIHIWPEHRYAALDIFSCGRSFKTLEAASFVIEQFQSLRPSVVEVRRGLITRTVGRGEWPWKVGESAFLKEGGYE